MNIYQFVRTGAMTYGEVKADPVTERGEGK
jgi:hypothetical protein